MAPASHIMPPDAYLTLPGLQTATASAGLYAGKAAGERADIMLLSFPDGATAAGLVTRSGTRSSAADWCAEHLPHPNLRAIIVNAGNANAFTGQAGKDDTYRLATWASSLVGCEVDQALVASTGVIGEPLPMDDLERAMKTLGLDLKPLDEGGHAQARWQEAARAIMTTDSVPKMVFASFTFKGHHHNLIGMTKGSGMIHPDMATMLTFLVTDAAIDAEVLDRCLREAAEETLHCLTIDGDTSTSDTCVLVATGKPPEDGDAHVTENTPFDDFRSALREALASLCRAVARDGEGAQRLITLRVLGADSQRQARETGRIIASSLLVKTALAAGDANWGRFVMAIGKAALQLGYPVDRDALRISIADQVLTEAGARAQDYDEARIARYLREDDVTVTLDLNRGDGQADVWTCDLTEEYVRINGAYRT